MSINAVNYNPDNFEDPEVFKPIRWRSDVGKHTPEKFNYNTFGAGPVIGNSPFGNQTFPFVNVGSINFFGEISRSALMR